MITHCANPKCFLPFKYLNEGRLFRLRLYPAIRDGAPPCRTTMVEYFWLCGSCSSAFTLIFDERRGVILAPLGNTPQEKRLTLILDITKYRSHDPGVDPKGARQWP